MKKIFITGISGFLGRHLQSELLNSHFELYGLTRQPINQPNSAVKLITGNINSPETYFHIIQQCQYVIHIAGEKKDSGMMQETNIEGTSKLLEAIQTGNFQSKLIYISSSGIYGIYHHPDNIITETSPCFPKNEYEKSKFKAEQLITKTPKDLSLAYMILRVSNVFGEYDPQKKLLFLIKLLLNRRFFYLDKEAYVNYVYVRLVTYIIHQIIKQNLFNNGIYNINIPCKIFNFIEIMKKELGLTYLIRTLPFFVKTPFKILSTLNEFFPIRYQYLTKNKYNELTQKKNYDITRIKQLISFNEMDFLVEGIRSLIANYKEQGDIQ